MQTTFSIAEGDLRAKKELGACWKRLRRLQGGMKANTPCNTNTSAIGNDTTVLEGSEYSQHDFDESLLKMALRKHCQQVQPTCEMDLPSPRP